MLRKGCPPPENLVALALDEAGLLGYAGRHVRSCEACLSEFARLRSAANGVRASAAMRPAPSSPCLNENELARLLDRDLAPTDGRAAHLLACGRCSRRFASATGLMNQSSVAAELRHLEMPGRSGRRGLATSAAAATLAAAALAAAVLLPRGAATPLTRLDPAVAIHRERAITTTVAPRIVGPAAIAGPSDSLRWTSVPHADRYEVRVFDREGTLVWNPITSDTVLPMSAHMFGGESRTYLWKVEARTGWDRFVASEWSDLTLSGNGIR